MIGDPKSENEGDKTSHVINPSVYFDDFTMNTTDARKLQASTGKV